MSKIDDIMKEEGYARVSDVLEPLGVETSQTIHRRIESGRYVGIRSHGMWWVNVKSLLEAHKDNPVLTKRINDLGIEPKDPPENADTDPAPESASA